MQEKKKKEKKRNVAFVSKSSQIEAESLKQPEVCSYCFCCIFTVNPHYLKVGHACEEWCLQTP